MYIYNILNILYTFIYVMSACIWNLYFLYKYITLFVDIKISTN